MGLFSKLKHAATVKTPGVPHKMKVRAHEERIKALKSKRGKEETRGELRATEKKEKERISKAKAMGKKKGSGWKAGAAKVGKGLQEASKFSGAMSESFMNIPTGTSMTGFDMPGQKPRKKATKKKATKKKQVVINF